MKLMPLALTASPYYFKILDMPNNQKPNQQSVETICAALLYMMSYYPRSNDPQLAAEIAKHLSWLEEAARSKGSNVLGETAHRLLALHWSLGTTVH